MHELTRYKRVAFAPRGSLMASVFCWGAVSESVVDLWDARELWIGTRRTP